MSKSIMLTTFGGKFIRIYTESFKRIMDSKGNIHEVPVMVEGYLMDEDDKYYYLSYNLSPDLISQAIKKTKGLIIENIKLTEQAMLDSENQISIEEAMTERSEKKQLN